MSQEFSLSDVDVDGAIAETRHEAIEGLSAGDSRRAFLKKAGIAGGTAMGGGAMLSALVPGAALALGGGRPPVSKFGAGDVGILRFALTLEYLESSFYNEATKHQGRKAFLHGPRKHQLQVFLKAVTDDENQHVAALQKTLGKNSIPRPKLHFNGDTQNQAGFIKSSFTFENTGVHAYSGQAFNIKAGAVLAAALSIVTVEARHAAAIGLISKGSTFGISPNNAFDTPFTAAQVLAGVHSLNYGL